MPNRRTLFLAAICLVVSPLHARESPPKVYDASLYSQAVTECDRLAAHTEDPDKVAPGVSEAKVDLDAAIAACRADVARDPGNPRLLYQFGRALAYAGQIEESLPNLERSVALA